MSTTTGTIPPPVSWAQRNDLVYVVIEVECTDIEHKVTENSFTFKGINVLDPSKKYDVTLNFFHEVNPEKVMSKNIGRCMEFTIYKKESGAYWPSLTSDKTKLHFLKANFAKWTNEPDEEDEESRPPGGNFMDPMPNFEEFNDFNLDDEDSDDNIPSLSQNDEDEDDVKDEKKEEVEKPEEKN